MRAQAGMGVVAQGTLPPAVQARPRDESTGMGVVAQGTLPPAVQARPRDESTGMGVGLRNIDNYTPLYNNYVIC